MSKSKPNRSRPHSYHIYLNDAEVEMVKNGMEAAHIDNFSKYARRMLTGGYILHVEDTNDIKAVGYQFRFYGAMEMVNECDDIYAVSHYLGHTNLKTTQHYIDKLNRERVFDGLVRCS